MAESQFFFSLNGQEITQSDLNTIGKVSGLADDRVLAELFRPTPYNGTTVSKLVIPYGVQGGGTNWIQPGGSGINIFPFRAMTGSRTAVGTSGLDNWRDGRSQISVGATTLAQTVSFASNSSGQSRWDLVYAKIVVDANGPSVTRYVKDPSLLIVTPHSISTFLESSVTLGTVTGTPSGTPALPAIPADSVGTYYIPLVYILILNGYTTGSLVGHGNLYVAAPVYGMQSNASGALQVRPASAQHQLSSTVVANWANTNARPAWYMSPEAAGGDSILVLLDLSNSSMSNWSHTSGSIIDNSTNWADRYFTWTAYFGSSTEKFASDLTANTASVSPYAANEWRTASLSDNIQLGWGQSFIWDSALTGSYIGNGAVVYTTGVDGLGHTWKLGVYCDIFTSGNPLKFFFDFGGGSGAFGFVLLKIDAITNPIKV